MAHSAHRRLSLALLIAVSLITLSLGFRPGYARDGNSNTQPQAKDSPLSAAAPTGSPKGMAYNGVANGKAISIGGDLRVTISPPRSWLMFSSANRRTYVFKRPYQESIKDEAGIGVTLSKIDNTVDRTPKIVVLEHIKMLKESLPKVATVKNVEVENGFHQLRMASGETLQLITSRYQKGNHVYRQVDAVGLSERVKVHASFAAPNGAAFEQTWPMVESSLTTLRIPNGALVSRFGGIETALVLPILIGLMVLFALYLLYWWWSRSRPSHRRYFKQAAENPEETPNYSEDPFALDHWMGDAPDIAIPSLTDSDGKSVPAIEASAKAAIDKKVAKAKEAERAKAAKAKAQAKKKASEPIADEKLAADAKPAVDAKAAAGAKPTDLAEATMIPKKKPEQKEPKKKGFWARLFGRGSAKDDKPTQAGAKVAAAAATAAAAAVVVDKATQDTPSKEEAKGPPVVEPAKASKEKTDNAEAQKADAQKAKAQDAEAQKAEKEPKLDVKSKGQELVAAKPEPKPEPKSEAKPEPKKEGFFARLFRRKPKVKPMTTSKPKNADDKLGATDSSANIDIHKPLDPAILKAHKEEQEAQRKGASVNPTVLLSEDEAGGKDAKETKVKVEKQDTKGTAGTAKASKKPDVTILTEEMAAAAKKPTQPVKKQPPTVESEFVADSSAPSVPSESNKAKAETVEKQGEQVKKTPSRRRAAKAAATATAATVAAAAAAKAADKDTEDKGADGEQPRAGATAKDEKPEQTKPEPKQPEPKKQEQPEPKKPEPKTAQQKQPEPKKSEQDDEPKDTSAYLTLSPSERTELTLLLDQIKGSFNRVDAILAEAETKSQEQEERIAKMAAAAKKAEDAST